MAKIIKGEFFFGLQCMNDLSALCAHVPSNSAANSSGILGSSFMKVLLTPVKNPTFSSIRVVLISKLSGVQIEQNGKSTVYRAPTIQ